MTEAGESTSEHPGNISAPQFLLILLQEASSLIPLSALPFGGTPLAQFLPRQRALSGHRQKKKKTKQNTAHDSYLQGLFVLLQQTGTSRLGPEGLLSQQVLAQEL